jgi:hypothetical protein
VARLRVASPGDTPTVPLSITEALDEGPRDVLAAMRYALAKKLDAGEVSSNAIASAYKELRELDRQIRAIDAAEQEEQRRGSSDGTRRSFSASAL